MHAKQLLAWTAVVVVVLLSFDACRTVIGEAMSGGELATELKRAGWTPVDLPRELLGPGSIVSITDTDGIRFRGKVETCLPKEAIVTHVAGAELPRGTKIIDFSATAFLRFHRVVRVGIGYQQVKIVRFEAGKVQEIALDEIRLTQHLRQMIKDFDPTCREYFIHPRVFVIVSALRVADYTYSILRADGSKIELSVENLNQYVDFGGGVDATVTAYGSLRIKEPLYIAFKKAKYFSLSEAPGAAPTDEEAHTVMERYYARRPLEW